MYQALLPAAAVVWPNESGVRNDRLLVGTPDDAIQTQAHERHRPANYHLRG